MRLPNRFGHVAPAGAEGGRRRASGRQTHKDARYLPLHAPSAGQRPYQSLVGSHQWNRGFGLQLASQNLRCGSGLAADLGVWQTHLRCRTRKAGLFWRLGSLPRYRPNQPRQAGTAKAGLG